MRTPRGTLTPLENHSLKKCFLFPATVNGKNFLLKPSYCLKNEVKLQWIAKKDQYSENSITLKHYVRMRTALRWISRLIPNLSKFSATTRGITRLDGARGKKQVWRPHVRAWGLCKQMYGVEGSTCDIVGTFRRPPQPFGAPIVARRPGNCSLLAQRSLRPW